MTDLDFDFIRAYLKQRSGLALTQEKRYLVESRLGPVCKRFGIDSLRDLVGALKVSRDSALEKAVVEAMTTNETFFFRDRVPFDMFRDVLLPQAIQRKASQRRLRIWCAASSTGQEPYSLAMLVSEASAKLSGWQVEIVATDLSTEVIEKAKLGLYSHFEAQRGLPVQLLLKYFTQVGEQWQISAAIRQMVAYRQLNLLHGFEPLGSFDIIFCRNVLIYFDAPTKADILGRLAASLQPGGALLLGAAETVIGLTEKLAPNPEHRGLYMHAPAAGPAAAAPAHAPLAAQPSVLAPKAVGFR